MSSLVCFHSIFRRVGSTLPYATTWTVLLIVTVVLVSLAPSLAFMFAVSQFSSSSKPCHRHQFVRIPFDSPTEMVCLPEHAVVSSSHFDFFLPTLFAALVVSASTCLLRSLLSA
ncbi:uncharacterized protein [Cicer arietinum]|uniref:Uncharacterized protein LOC101505814 n=1 Tax=Cicer arietinum TaxID=3827 RepID=A0A1S2XCM4_CICAR|nr:uncharacterized protein LOC101505814 [Cicer arietinum]